MKAIFGTPLGSGKTTLSTKLGTLGGSNASPGANMELLYGDMEGILESVRQTWRRDIRAVC